MQIAEHFDPFWQSILRINSGLWSVSTTYLFSHFEKPKCKDTGHKVVHRGILSHISNMDFQFLVLQAGLVVRENISISTFEGRYFHGQKIDFLQTFSSVRTKGELNTLRMKFWCLQISPKITKFGWLFGRFEDTNISF